MKQFLLATALTASVAAMASEVAFVKPTTPSTQENGALTYFQQANLGTVIDAGTANFDAFDCVWIHVDRKGIVQGISNLPSEITGKVDALKSYVQNGGKVYLSGHATQLITAIGRTTESPNVFGSGDGGNGEDIWAISGKVGEDVDHAVYTELAKVENTQYVQYGMLYGGGSAILREDHNCMWSLSNEFRSFEDRNACKVLGSWGQDQNGSSAGLVEFGPKGDFKGTVLCNGFAACQWVVENGTNAYQDNLEKLTSNALTYLAELKPAEGGEEPEEPTPGDETEFEVPESSGKVALMLVYEDQMNEVDNNNFEAGVKTKFNELFPSATTIYANKNYQGEVDLTSYDCVWIHMEREMNSDWAASHTPLVDNLKAYVAQGGNLYLTKRAVSLVFYLGVVNRQADEWGTNYALVDRNDPWQTNVQSNGTDWSGHTIFNGIETVDNGYGKLINLLGPGARHQDVNSMWNLGNAGGHDNFCAQNNARVLGTWGHNGGQGFAGIIEFMPGNGQNKAISKDAADARKGTVLVNGLAAYTVAPADNTTNPYQENIDTLTKNSLSYLSPKVDESSSTGVDAMMAAEGAAEFYTLQGVRVANPANGLYIKVQGGKATKVMVK